MKQKRIRRSDPLDFDWLLLPWDAAVAAWRGLRAALRSDSRARWALGVLLLALALRLVRPDWYGNRLFHPDERWIFDKTAELHLWGEPGRNDPAGMQYGSLPLYTVSLAKDALHAATKMGAHRAAMLAGRTLTGLVDALSVLAVLLLAWRLAGPGPALLAALVLACAPLSIQLAHFFTVDPWLTLFGVTTLYASLRVKETRSLAWSAAAGVSYAAALASKSAGLPLLLPILLGHLWPGLAPGLASKERRALLKRAGLGLAVAAGATLAAFFVFMPWAFLNFKKFLANQTAQRDILVTGSPGGVPFVRQYWDTGYGFHLKNIALYYVGLPAGLLALLALPWLAGLGLRDAVASWSQGAVKARPRVPRPRQGADGPWQRAFGPLLLLSWALPYFLVVGSSFAKFARYMLPLLPVLAIALAMGLDRLRQRLPGLGRVLQWGVAVFALGHGLGYGLTYLRPHPWIQASRWAFENIPATTADPAAPGGQRPTRVLNEDWGDDLPVDVPGAANLRYENLKGRSGHVNIVEWDSANKLERLSRSLAEADVLFLADARAYGTYLRLPTRFPLTHAYYDLLFRDPGRLGFELAYQASNPVRVFGLLPLPDSRIPSVPRRLWADESFTLYDRPHAFVFRRIQPRTAEQQRQTLLDRVDELGLSREWLQGRGPEELHKLSRGQAASAAAPERLNDNYGRDRGAMRPLLHPVLTWWLLVTVLGWLALPLAARVFGAWPAGGYALSKALGLLLFGWLAYNLAWLKALPFTQAGLWGLLAGLAVLAAWGLRRRRDQARAWLRVHRAEILFSEAVFAAAFLYFVVVRAYNPNIHDVAGPGYFGGGEPLGMTYLSAVTRCVSFPAYDPWLSLHDSSYYYFGYVLAGALTKLSGFEPAVTYNLSLALFFSLALLGAYGVLRGFVARPWLALGGAAMVALAGSLWSLGYIGLQMNRGQGPLNALFSHGFIWDPTRFPELVSGHIFEFPYFSYLYGDLHPHNMVVPFSLVLLALLAVPFLSREAGWRSVGPGAPRAALWLGLTALLLDSQYALNTWSWPVFVALAGGALLIGPWAGKGLGLAGSLKAAAWGAGLLAAGLGLGRLLMGGFRAYFLQSGGDRVGRVLPGEWQMSAYIPLAFFLPGLLALALLAGRRVRAQAQALAKPLGADRLRRYAWLDRGLILAERLFERRLGLGLGLGLGLLLVGGLLGWSLLQFPRQGVWALALGLGFLCVGLFQWGGWRDGREAFVWVLGGFTCLLVAGSEFWFVADRMNTIFKFWFNGWILMGLAFGVGLAWAFGPAREPAAPARRGRRPRLPLDAVLPWVAGLGLALLFLAAAWWDARLMGRGGRFIVSFLTFSLVLLGLFALGLLAQGRGWSQALLKGVFAAALGLGLLYPLGATVTRIHNTSGFKDPRLNGTDFMAERTARSGHDAKDYDRHDHALIRWLNANAPLTEVLLEAPGIEMYKGFSRYAIYTGLPTLLGWEYQVGQQLGNRAGGVLGQRRQDAARIYTADDAQAVELLRRHRVRWIVAGSIERRLYGEAIHAKFARIAQPVASDGPSVLYRFEWERP